MISSLLVLVIATLLKQIQHDLPIKGLGPLDFLWVLKLTINLMGIFSQSLYIMDLLQRANMHNAKLVATPMSIAQSLYLFDSEAFLNSNLYCSMVGALQ